MSILWPHSPFFILNNLVTIIWNFVGDEDSLLVSLNPFSPPTLRRFLIIETRVKIYNVFSLVTDLVFEKN